METSVGSVQALPDGNTIWLPANYLHGGSINELHLLVGQVRQVLSVRRSAIGDRPPCRLHGLAGLDAHQTRTVGILPPNDRGRTVRVSDECRLALGPVFEEIWNDGGLMTREIVLERAEAAIDG